MSYDESIPQMNVKKTDMSSDEPDWFETIVKIDVKSRNWLGIIRPVPMCSEKECHAKEVPCRTTRCHYHQFFNIEQCRQKQSNPQKNQYWDFSD